MYIAHPEAGLPFFFSSANADADADADSQVNIINPPESPRLPTAGIGGIVVMSLEFLAIGWP